MTLFVDSLPNLTGVFAQERQAPTSVTPAGTGVSVIVAAFAWGPPNSLVYPTSPGELYRMYAPDGSDRTNSGYLSVVRKAWPILGVVRALDPAAVNATATLHGTGGGAGTLDVEARWPGALGNSITLTVGAADDGNASHFNLTATLSGPSGQTIEIYRNLNISGTGLDVLPNLASSTLLASVTKSVAGTLSAGNTVMSGGTDGTTTDLHYTGTPGGGDFGFALLENDKSINYVFTDRPGDAAVNAGLVAHVELTGDRVGFIAGSSGQSLSQLWTDVALYRSSKIVYCDPWVYEYDDSGTLQLVPAVSFAASVAAQTPPSTSIAWRKYTSLLNGIVGVEVDRGSARGQSTAQGVCTVIKADTGGFTFEDDVVTWLVAGETALSRTRMGQFMARSLLAAWQPWVNGPNVPLYQQDLMTSAATFFGVLKRNATFDPGNLPFILDFEIEPAESANTQADEANGDFTVAANVKLGSQMKRIVLSMEFGATVTITAS